MYLNKIINKIEDNNSVILCGETSSGKSTLINNLIGSNLTTSKYNNTTLDFIKLKYLNYFIYDTPGIMINENKKISDKIIVSTKQLSDKYVLIVDDIKMRVNGNLTFIVPDNVKINSKKEDVKLGSIIKIDKPSDIELKNGGFIFIKSPCIIEANEELGVRNSIIGR